MSEKAKIKPQPEASYGTYQEGDWAVAWILLGVLICIAVMFLFNFNWPQPDVWAQMDRDFSACIVRGIDEVSCQRIALEMAGVDLAGIGVEVDVAE